ncbi:MAG: bifunctional phosphoribosylaminoimidazolecarboxamide formyltransferase/IMP cyclohydrolase [Acidobacteria bacterium]|nr:bifunctional phosphoribosylaminoimidazolecarboxamide formyltransferase/IMP cyclohydrolase [Acidobacteriota bacterium]
MSPSQRRRALVSVYHKEGIAEFCRHLAALDIDIISTGGTARHLTEAGVKVTLVEAITGFPEMMDGRVKTLHPMVHGPILFRRDLPSHVEQANQHGMIPVDIVAVNLYPFAETVRQPDAGDSEIIEMIDIGGPAMVRAAAKNHDAVTVLVNPDNYPAVLKELQSKGETSRGTRRRLAATAFAHCAAYDAEVASYLSNPVEEQAPPAIYNMQFSLVGSLRYGENPHQQAALYREASPAAGSVVAARVLQGKELSYNNYLDLDAAWSLAAEWNQPAAVVVKHNNPCGAAVGETLCEAYIAAREADPQSAFGGIVAVNRPVDKETATELATTFLEAIFAPGFAPAAREILARKKNLRLLDSEGARPGSGRPRRDFRRISGGLLLQDTDVEPEDMQWRVVTRRSPTPEEDRAMRFAWKVARFVRSNAIVYALGDRTLGIGAGQMSRVDAARIGALKARTPLKGSALASDAFFPFRDSLDQAAAEGVTAVVEPGGSIRDEEVIAAADEAGIAMVFTGVRHFRH